MYATTNPDASAVQPMANGPLLFYLSIKLIIQSGIIFPSDCWLNARGQGVRPQFSSKLENHLNIGMLHIKLNQKTPALQWKYV